VSYVATAGNYDYAFYWHLPGRQPGLRREADRHHEHDGRREAPAAASRPSCRSWPAYFISTCFVPGSIWTSMGALNTVQEVNTVSLPRGPENHTATPSGRSQAANHGAAGPADGEPGLGTFLRA
jgi:hypothetical protein